MSHYKYIAQSRFPSYTWNQNKLCHRKANNYIMQRTMFQWTSISKHCRLIYGMFVALKTSQYQIAARCLQLITSHVRLMFSKMHFTIPLSCPSKGYMQKAPSLCLNACPTRSQLSYSGADWSVQDAGGWWVGLSADTVQLWLLFTGAVNFSGV